MSSSTFFQKCGAFNDIDIIRRSYMIEPFNPGQVQPVSYDVLLGDSYKRLRSTKPRNIARPSESEWESYEHAQEIRIRAHEFLLASTLETVHIPTRGSDRCPHAIDPALPCPRAPKRRQARQRMRNIGR